MRCLRANPLLSCWERQAEGVDERAERGEAGLDGLRVWERHERQPREEQAGGHLRVEEQPQGVEVVFPATAGVPGGMGFQGGSWRRFCCGRRRRGGG